MQPLDEFSRRCDQKHERAAKAGALEFGNQDINDRGSREKE